MHWTPDKIKRLLVRLQDADMAVDAIDDAIWCIEELRKERPEEAVARLRERVLWLEAALENEGLSPPTSGQILSLVRESAKGNDHE